MFQASQRFVGIDRNDVLTPDHTEAHVYRNGQMYRQHQNLATRLNRNRGLHSTLGFIASAVAAFFPLRLMITWDMGGFNLTITLLYLLITIIGATAARWATWIITTIVLSWFEPPLILMTEKDNT